MSRESSRASNRDGEGRKNRVPLGVPRNKMSAKAPTGYVGRWMNDEGNRLADAKEGGWEFSLVKSKTGEGAESTDTDLGQYTSMLVGTKEGGGPLRAYWMIIHKEWYEQDQAEKMKPVDEIEKAIKGGKFDPSGASREGQYVPKSGIKIN